MAKVDGTHIKISIHALREEGDFHHPARGHRGRVISIHALREEGDAGALSAGSGHCISIHALREEGDRCHRQRPRV